MNAINNVLASNTTTTTLQFPISEVWDFFTSPKHMTNWLTVSTNYSIQSMVMSWKVNGFYSYSVVPVQNDNGFGFDFDFAGRYVDIQPNKSLTLEFNDGFTAVYTFTQFGGKVSIKQTIHYLGYIPSDFHTSYFSDLLNNFTDYIQSHKQ